MSDASLKVHDQVEQYLPDQQQKEHATTVDRLNRQILALVVDDPNKETQAAELRGEAKRRQGAFENLRLAIVQPFNQHINRINAYFKGLSRQYDPLIEAVDKKLLDYRQELDRKEALRKAEETKKLSKQNEKARETAEKKGVAPEVLMKAAPATYEAPKSVQAATTRLTYREDRAFEISPEALKNPAAFFDPQFIKVDEQKLAAAVRGKLLDVGSYRWGKVFVKRTPLNSKL